MVYTKAHSYPVGETPAIWPQNPCSFLRSKTDSGVSASTSGKAIRTLQEGERVRANGVRVDEEEDCEAGEKLGASQDQEM